MAERSLNRMLLKEISQEVRKDFEESSRIPEGFQLIDSGPIGEASWFGEVS